MSSSSFVGGANQRTRQPQQQKMARSPIAEQSIDSIRSLLVVSDGPIRLQIEIALCCDIVTTIWWQLVAYEVVVALTNFLVCLLFCQKSQLFTMKFQTSLVLSFLACAFASDAPGPALRSRKLEGDCAGNHDHDCDGVPDHDSEDHDDGGGCFSALGMVLTQDKGTITMDSLQVGDFVQVGENEFSRIYSLAHLAPEVESDFLQIFTKGKEAPLEITGRHMVYAKGTPIRADSIKVGDTLHDENMVTDIKVVKRAGLYAPLTETGDIVVNGIKASNYVAFMDHGLVNQHYLAHYFFSFQRTICRVNFDLCENETHTADEGFSTWSNWGIQLYMLGNYLPAIAQHIVILAALLVLPVFYTLEQLTLSPFLGFATIGYALHRAISKKAKVA